MSRRIKVLQVLSVEKEAFFFSNLVDYSDDKEVEFVFANFAPCTEFAETMKNRNLTVHSLGRFRKLLFAKAFWNLWNVINFENPDIVHTHLFDPTYVGLLVAKLQGRKTVLTRHHSDAVHAIKSGLKRRAYLELERQNNRRADHIVALSKMTRVCLVDWEKVPESKVSLIPNPQSLDRYDTITPEVTAKKRQQLGMGDQISLVCVSRLVERKGHAYLFQALAPLLHRGLRAKLYLVGEGAHRENLESMVRDLRIAEQVEFLGWRDDALAIMGAADIIVHPSLEDALSQALIESLMQGETGNSD